MSETPKDCELPDDHYCGTCPKCQELLARGTALRDGATMLDIVAEGGGIEVRFDGKTLWVNVGEICRLRICNVQNAGGIKFDVPMETPNERVERTPHVNDGCGSLGCVHPSHRYYPKSPTPISEFQFLVDTPNPEVLNALLQQMPPEGMNLLVTSDSAFAQRDGHYIVQGPDVGYLRWSIEKQGYGYATLIDEAK